jgi:hypothetical protein
MLLCALPALLSSWFQRLSCSLDRRTHDRFWSIFFGLFLTRERRRTASSWFRAGGIGEDFRRAYETIGSVGRRAVPMATSLFLQVEQSVATQDEDRWVYAIDDTPCKRYGPSVEGAGIHHNPTPGPTGEKFFYGHVFVTVARLVVHSDWGTIALPLRAELYVRQKDLPKIAVDHRPSFRTKLELAIEQLKWLHLWHGKKRKPIWVVVDGGYSKEPVLSVARNLGITVVGRLRCDSALRTLPEEQPKSKRGRKPIYGKQRIDLAKRAGQPRGWSEEEMVVYGEVKRKRFKTFLATWQPAGGVIRVVVVDEPTGWVAYFCTDPNATVAEILGLVSERGALEQTFHDVKEVEGAGEQQLRNLDANVGAFHMNLWAYTMLEIWAWDKPEEELMDRSASPWDREYRRPSHADRRKCLIRELLRAEIQAVCSEPLQREQLQQSLEKLLQLAI